MKPVNSPAPTVLKAQRDATYTSKQLNMTASNSYVKRKVKEMDFNGDGVLQFNEFVFLMRALGERPEV